MLNDQEYKYKNIIKNFNEKFSEFSDLNENILIKENQNLFSSQNFDFSKLLLLENDKNIDFAENQKNYEKIKREILNETKYAQPAILLHSYLNYLKFLEQNNKTEKKFAFFFGPSLGEIISLVAAESIDLYTAGIMLFNRGKFMQESCPKGKGSMLNVVGDIEKSGILFEKFLENLKAEKKFMKNKIGISSIMNKRLLVLSGETELIEECGKFLKNNSVACKKLIVSAAFHSNLMLEGSLKFKEYLFDEKNKIFFKYPKFPVLSTINPDFVYDRGDGNEKDFDLNVKNLLVEQFFKKVDILGCVKKLVILNEESGDKVNSIYDVIKRKYIDLNEFI